MSTSRLFPCHFLALLLSFSFAAADSGRAAVIALTGGDAGEGYAPLSSTYAALDFNGSGLVTIQGVVFTTSHPSVAISGSIGGSSGALDANYSLTTANDTSLRNMGGTTIFGIGVPIQVTISGLAVGQTYQVDTFSGLRNNFSTRTMTVTSAGATTLSDSFAIAEGAPNYNVLYDVRHTLQPDPFGVITLTYTSSPFMSPTVNGFSITMVPEPAALSLVALGAGLLAWRRRRALPSMGSQCRNRPTISLAPRARRTPAP